jgi:hypothetical protein
MNVSRISAPFAMILAAWSASAQMPDVAVTTPDATIAVEPGQQVDVPLFSRTTPTRSLPKSTS